LVKWGVACRVTDRDIDIARERREERGNREHERGGGVSVSVRGERREERGERREESGERREERGENVWEFVVCRGVLPVLFSTPHASDFLFGLKDGSIASVPLILPAACCSEIGLRKSFSCASPLLMNSSRRDLAKNAFVSAFIPCVLEVFANHQEES
jgi:hypothetical protein